MLPDYLAKAAPVPAEKRSPWYANTAPTYAGIFLWVVFYMEIAAGTLNRAGIGLSLLALVAAAVICYALFYWAPAMLGMQTGYPLYVVGSSTFGTKGGYLMPGLLMGILQVGWLSVNSFVSATFILSGFGTKAEPGTLPFIVIAGLWAFGMAYIGVKGIQYVARFALYLNFVPLLMILIVFFRTAGAAGDFTPTEGNPYIGIMLLIQIVVGFFATAGAAGADFAMNNRDARDVRWGGWIGIVLAIVIAGGLPLISVAGARVLYSLEGFRFDAVISAMGGFLASVMFFLFAIASVPPACFTSFVMANSFATMIPKVPRLGTSMAGATVAFLLAVTGAAGNLVGVFTIIGASFGPICGAMLADYLLSGRKWAGPREGVSIPGYAAWAVGFVIGILPFLPISAEIKPYLQPAAVYSFIAGFVVYAVLAKAGLAPKTLPMAGAAAD